MPQLTVLIVRYVDDAFPGWVESEFLDAYGKLHVLRDKAPVFSEAELAPDSDYPCQGVAACEVVSHWLDEQGRALVRITTGRPYGIESVQGLSDFVVLSAQITEDKRRYVLFQELGRLELAGSYREMIPIQLEIIAEVERTRDVPALANAWNHLLGLHHQIGEYDKAEDAARKGLEIYAAEPKQYAMVLCDYQFKLAHILAAQRRFAEAVRVAQAGIANLQALHNPPDEFLKAREQELKEMRDLSRCN